MTPPCVKPDQYDHLLANTQIEWHVAKIYIIKYFTDLTVFVPARLSKILTTYELFDEHHDYSSTRCYINTTSNFNYILQLNTLRPRQNGRYIPDDIFKRIFLNETWWISLKIWLKFVPNVRINKIPASIQVMAWRRPGDKPLSEPMMVRLPTLICVTRPQWVNVQCKLTIFVYVIQCEPLLTWYRHL